MVIYNYLTTNLINGKKYIGMHSTNNVDDDYLGSGRLIVKAFKKYGKENFKREILCFCDDVSSACNNESLFIKEYDTLNPNGYNLHPNGGTAKGYKISEETRKKLIELRNTPEYKEKISKANTGKKRSEEAKEKMRQKKIGHVPWNKDVKGAFISHRKGKSLEEEYGIEKANEIKMKLHETHLNKPSHRKGKSLEEEYGIEKANEIRLKRKRNKQN